MTTETILTDESIIRTTTTTTVKPRRIDWDDIEFCIEADDWDGSAPWDNCEGWEHDIRMADHDGQYASAGFVRPSGHTSGRIITIDDSVIINHWGFTRCSGESKQCHAERIARIKRKAIDQLVKWYRDGWEYWYVCARYDGETLDGCGGVDCLDYAASMEYEVKSEAAARLEEEGYIVENRPDPPKPYTAADRLRDRIRSNLNPYYCH